jgi:hypothetical protein
MRLGVLSAIGTRRIPLYIAEPMDWKSKVPRRKRRILSVSKRAVTIGDNVDKDLEVGGLLRGIERGSQGKECKMYILCIYSTGIYKSQVSRLTHFIPRSVWSPKKNILYSDCVLGIHSYGADSGEFVLGLHVVLIGT